MAAPLAQGPGTARVTPHSVKVIADSLGLPPLPDDVATAHAAEVEHRIRQVIQVRVCVSLGAGC